MKVIDVYSRYYRAEAQAGGVARNGALVRLTAVSENGTVSYEIGASFFPHVTDDDFAVSYDAQVSRVIYSAPGRRSSKREKVFLEELQEGIDGLAGEKGWKIFWDCPLGPARNG